MSGRLLPARLALACLALAGAPRVEAATAAAPPPRRVLFVGNSLTRTNDLPAVVRALAAADGLELEVAAVVRDGFSLADHRAAGVALERVAAGGWDVVVLQQGPSALPESRVELLREAEIFARAIRAAGARPALFMVWPSRERAFDLPRVVESYRLAAAASDALLAPAGEAWRLALRRSGAPTLWGRDGLHPTPAGTYLAALTVYGALTGREVAALPDRLELDAGAIRLSERAGRALRECAATALGLTPSKAGE